MATAHPGVLTDVGTNELEVVEFIVGDRPYAINVAKVREIVRLQKAMVVPEAHPCLVGVFRNREHVVPLIDLGRWLGAAGEPDPAAAKIIVAEFNRMRVGFLVHGVRRIHRITWADLETPAQGSMVHSRSALGFMRLGAGGDDGERIVFLLDFERIVAEIHAKGGNSPDRTAEDGLKIERRKGHTILIAEDSPLIRKMIRQRLEGGGYSVVETTNGQEALDALQSGLRAHAVISDIEMPRMDGHHLTRRIKQDEGLRGVPVVLYSSMIYEEMRRKGESVGADAQICKPDLARLVETLDELVFAEGPIPA